MSVILTALLFLIPGAATQWLDVPFVPQSRDGCGAAAIAMVMQYWIRTNLHLDSAAADDSRIYKLLSTPGRRGISGDKLR